MDMNLISGKSVFSGTVLASAIMVAGCVAGCRHAADMLEDKMPHRTFHENFDLKAEDFFNDPKVIELCEAIGENDLDKIRRLIASGADVNAKGRDNVTPLLWAFPDNQLERFTLLLEHGADPNVKLTGDLGIPSAFDPGDSVTMLAARTRFPGYLEMVLEHNGDPNITDRWGNPVLHKTIASEASNKTKRVKLLADAGADVNGLNTAGWPPTITAVAYRSQFHIALLLLELGTDPSTTQRGNESKLIHSVVRAEDKLHLESPHNQSDHQRLLNKLIGLGEDPEAARADVKRWSDPDRLPPWVN